MNRNTTYSLQKKTSFDESKDQSIFIRIIFVVISIILQMNSITQFSIS